MSKMKNLMGRIYVLHFLSLQFAGRIVAVNMRRGSGLGFCTYIDITIIKAVLALSSIMKNELLTFVKSNV
jgi:hypothetical protein